jgi:large subunit ribosomal protein L6
MPIDVPASATVTISEKLVTVKGPKGELKQLVSDRIDVVQEGQQLLVTRRTDEPVDRSLHGLYRTLVYNMVRGVTEGYEKILEIQGVGYRAALKGKTLELALGYSHPVVYQVPEGIEFELPVPTRVIVRGCDKQLVGQVAAEIRAMRKPDPYKGKGIRYRDEKVRRKVGKAIK